MKQPLGYAKRKLKSMRYATSLMNCKILPSRKKLAKK